MLLNGRERAATVWRVQWKAALIGRVEGSVDSTLYGAFVGSIAGCIGRLHWQAAFGGSFYGDQTGRRDWVLPADRAETRQRRAQPEFTVGLQCTLESKVWSAMLLSIMQPGNSALRNGAWQCSLVMPLGNAAR